MNSQETQFGALGTRGDDLKSLSIQLLCSLGEEIGVGKQTDFKNSVLKKVKQLYLVFNILV